MRDKKAIRTAVKALAAAMVLTLTAPAALTGGVTAFASETTGSAADTSQSSTENSLDAASNTTGTSSGTSQSSTADTAGTVTGTNQTDAQYTGFREEGGKKYYYQNGTRYTKKGFKAIDGKRYYFQKKGVVYTKKGFKTISKKKYYFYADGSIATGLKKISGKKYLFNNKGVLLTNKRAYKLSGKYYNTDKKGRATRISAKKAKCEKAAAAFIKKHGGKGSNAKKFRSCYRYLLGYMKYSPGYFKWYNDKKYYSSKDGIYKLALETFEAPDLRGNCHRFAACVAAVASELGYTPYVITTKGDHSFVIIDGKYYDNMGAMFGASSHSPYSVYHKQKY